MAVLKGLKPEKVFAYFEKLCSVPHGSGNTKIISDLCVDFAKELGLKTAKYYYAKSLDELKEAAAKVGFPCVIKPLTQWGNKKYMNMKHLEAALDDASIAG